MSEEKKVCDHGAFRDECEICEGLFRTFIEMLEEGNEAELSPWDWPWPYDEWPYTN